MLVSSFPAFKWLLVLLFLLCDAQLMPSDTFVQDAARVIKDMIQKIPNSVNFNVMALSKKL